jgi:hypothetical protein
MSANMCFQISGCKITAVSVELQAAERTFIQRTVKLGSLSVQAELFIIHEGIQFDHMDIDIGDRPV